MSESRRMADEAKRFGEEVQEGAQRFGREYQKAAETGFESASRSFSEANRGFQALAAAYWRPSSLCGSLLAPRS
jgi:hypothetical protein